MWFSVILSSMDTEDKLITNVLKAKTAIAQYIDSMALDKSEDITGRIPCPICGKGTLSFSRVSYNEHIWGRCSTEGCLEWLE